MRIPRQIKIGAVIVAGLTISCMGNKEVAWLMGLISGGFMIYFIKGEE